MTKSLPVFIHDGSVTHHYYQISDDIDMIDEISEMSLEEINNHWVLFHHLEFDRLLFKITNNRLGKHINTHCVGSGDGFPVHCGVNQLISFPLNWETMLCGIMLNHSEFEDLFMNVFDRDTVIKFRFFHMCVFCSKQNI